MKSFVVLSLAISLSSVVSLAQTKPALGISAFEMQMINESVDSVPKADLPQFRSIIYKAQQKVVADLKTLERDYTPEKQEQTKKLLGMHIDFPNRGQEGAGPMAMVSPIRNFGASLQARTETEAREFGEDVQDGWQKIAAAKVSGNYGIQTKLDEATFDLVYIEGCRYERSEKNRSLMHCPIGAKSDDLEKQVGDLMRWQTELQSKVGAASWYQNSITGAYETDYKIRAKLLEVDSILSGGTPVLKFPEMKVFSSTNRPAIF